MIDLVIVRLKSPCDREEEITNRLAALVVQNAYFVFGWYRREFLTTLYLNPVCAFYSVQRQARKAGLTAEIRPSRKSVNPKG
jgi:hypothetical protein